MDYDSYKFSLYDWIIIILESIGCSAVVAYLFYDNAYALFIMPGAAYVIQKRKRKTIIIKRKEKLTIEFMDVLKNISSNLIAGYSLENAWKEAEREIKLLYGENSYILAELKEMNRQIAINQPLEKILEDFAIRSRVEDIENFSDIFSFAKRSGGKFVEIIESTTYRMWDKFETKREIQVSVSAKKLEQKAMDVIPLFILIYLRAASSDYMSSLYGNLFGIVFMTICLGAYVLSIVLAEKMLDIQI